MQMPTLAPRFVAALLLVGGTLTACSHSDTSTSPSSTLTAGGSSAAKAPAPLEQNDTARTIVVIEPGRSYEVTVGNHHLAIPANSICDIATSGYGATMWNAPCTPSATPVTVTATAYTNLLGYPVVEFTPALRFSPQNTATLSLYVAHPRLVASNWQILYCATSTSLCVQEDEWASWNNANKTVSRRIKHFSGYMVSE